MALSQGLYGKKDLYVKFYHWDFIDGVDTYNW